MVSIVAQRKWGNIKNRKLIQFKFSDSDDTAEKPTNMEVDDTTISKTSPPSGQVENDKILSSAGGDFNERVE